jgi:hypothetical protein
VEKCKLTETKKGKTGEEKNREYAHNFLSQQRGLLKKNSSWQAKQ